MRKRKVRNLLCYSSQKKRLGRNGVMPWEKFICLSGGNDVNAYQRPLEGIDYPRFVRRYQTIRID